MEGLGTESQDAFRSLLLWECLSSLPTLHLAWSPFLLRTSGVPWGVGTWSTSDPRGAHGRRSHNWAWCSLGAEQMLGDRSWPSGVPEVGQKLSGQRFQNPLKVKLCVGSAIACCQLVASGASIGVDVPVSCEQAVGRFMTQRRSRGLDSPPLGYPTLSCARADRNPRMQRKDRKGQAEH